MGINTGFAKFLFYCKTQGVNFDRTLTLGRQKLYISKNELAKELLSLDYMADLSDIASANGYSEQLFKILGSGKLDSIDYSDYEGANIIYDLNKAISSDLYNAYSVVLDSGTLEHVFNFPVAIRNCMLAVQEGGYFIAITPTNNMMGHGFYQFSPELYFRIFSVDNGFNTELALIGICDKKGEIIKWYRVKDPQEVKQRVILSNQHQTYLLILARKINTVEIFKQNPYQSDYVVSWESSAATKAHQKSEAKKELKKILPRFLVAFVSRILSINKNKMTVNEYMGKYNSNHFTEFSFPPDLHQS